MSADRVLTAADELVRSLGGRAKAARRAGHGRRYLERGHGSLRLVPWLDCLDAWGVEPHRLMSWAHVVYAYEFAGAIEQAGIEATAFAKRRAEPASAQAVRLAYLRGELNETPSTEGELRELEKLDDLRYIDPSRAVRRAERVAVTARSAETVARALGSWASALRLVKTNPRGLPARLRRGHVLLWMSLRLAAAARADLAVADALGRLVYVTSDRASDYEQGVRLARAMAAIYDRQGPDFQEGRGRALVTLGIVLNRAGNADDATLAFSRSMELLSSVEGESSRPRMAALQNLAALAAQAGDFERAQQFVLELDACEVSDSHTRARIVWMRAFVAAARNELATAVRLYEETLDQLGTSSPCDSALAGAELVQVLTELGQPEVAHSLARRLAWAVAPLEALLPAAAAALADLVKASHGAAQKAALRNAVHRLIAVVGERAPLQGATATKKRG